MVYIVACDKKTETYEEIFNELLKLKPEFKPKHITIDFEQAAIKALNNCFPESSIHGCYFHFSQNLWKHVQQVGLKTKYSEDPDFALNIRLILSLPFIPIEDIEAAFQEIANSDFFMENEASEYNDSIQNFLNYVESTYIGRFDRRGIRKPGMFPIELWNVYNLTLEGKLRKTLIFFHFSEK